MKEPQGGQRRLALAGNEKNPIGLCPPATPRWARRDRPGLVGEAATGAFAQLTHHLLVARVDQYTDMPAPSVAPRP